MAHRGFIAEFNRPIAYRQHLIGRLEKRGFEVEDIGHKTAFLLRYGAARKFRQLKRALVRMLHHRLGGVLLVSKQTGNAWRASNRGNRPGRLVRI